MALASHTFCCGLPLLVQLGAIGGAAASWADNIRPYFLAGGVSASLFGVWLAFRQEKKCHCSSADAHKRHVRQRKIIALVGLAVTLTLVVIPELHPHA